MEKKLIIIALAFVLGPFCAFSQLNRTINDNGKDILYGLPGLRAQRAMMSFTASLFPLKEMMMKYLTGFTETLNSALPASGEFWAQAQTG